MCLHKSFVNNLFYQTGKRINGESAGTTGGAKQMEAIQVKLVPKNESVNKGGKAYYDLTGTASSNTGGNNQYKRY